MRIENTYPVTEVDARRSQRYLRVLKWLSCVKARLTVPVSSRLHTSKDEESMAAGQIGQLAL